MGKFLRNLGAYNKTTAAALGTGAALATALLGLGNLLPESLAGWLTAGAAGATTVAVFMIRNQGLVDQLGDRAADLLNQ
ncbi:hypothetical protein OHB12_16315 [Nocardia sp. NBC_01730]|uniref:hypothetical protein n=1 Tax=Nocardia sp. NBC_01730 TaxID=2975998 RepID=UPI002E1263C5|nr:hypothetical protein OHB12_16315 [Nocardia sp. NBC_01730]